MRYRALLVACLLATYAHADDMGVVLKVADIKFTPIPGLPSCSTGAVLSGDPAKGPSTLAFKAKAGCVVPWHWHTPTEQVMLASGAAKFQMKGPGGAKALGPGGYAMMPSKHIHQFTCTSACTGFVTSDAAFDIHYVDAAGKDIPLEAALAKRKK